MRRAVFVGATLTSLALFTAAAVGWVASRFRTDVVLVNVGTDDQDVLGESHGELMVGARDRSTAQEGPGDGSSVGWTHLVFPSATYDLSSVTWLLLIGDRQSRGGGNTQFGYVVQTDAMEGERPGRAVYFPHWAVLAVAAPLPAVGLARWWRARRRRRVGQCARCGYDLRATPGRCPECGAGRAGTPPG